ncbi:MAG: hypothetical protein DRN33_03745 [Thermoplasmata archaeon]|nr:MAG: hypothetical protein DRN33_03745 [Thermoplasmata archaeon]
MDVIGLATLITGVSSGIAIVLSIYTYYLSKREKSYADLDSLYLKFLELGMRQPKFRNPEYTKNYKEMFKDDEDELYRYDTYAFIAWNICETIYDRKDEALFETWRPVIVAENKLHRKWFDDPENYHKFKDRFREYIHDNFPQEY